jgi:LPXTG-motif cell wall-anchored protein
MMDQTTLMMILWIAAGLVLVLFILRRRKRKFLR